MSARPLESLHFSPSVPRSALASYDLGGFWDGVWAMFVDIFSLALLAWMASGLIMWWKLPGTGLRRWGWLALAAGAVSFALIIARL